MDEVQNEVQKQIAGVFFGGGAFIALHAGYSKGPLSGVKFDRVYGVSAGSLWATIYGFLGVEKGIEALSTIDNNGKVFVTKDNIAKVGDQVFRAYPGLQLGFQPLHDLLTKYITGKPTIPVTVSRVCLNTGFHQHVTANVDGTFSTDNDALGKVETLADFINAVLCSCLTFPIVDAWIDPKTGYGWIDGGFREAGPVSIALENGATELHVCLTGLFNADAGVTDTDRTIIGGITNAMLIMANQNMVNDVDLVLEEKEVLSFIYAVKGQGSSMNFNQTDMQANIELASKVVAMPAGNLKPID